MLVDHLFVDAEKMFYPAVDFRRNASILNLLAYLRNYVGDKLIADGKGYPCNPDKVSRPAA